MYRVSKASKNKASRLVLDAEEVTVLPSINAVTALVRTDVAELKTDVMELLRTLIRGSAGALVLCI